MLVGYPSRVTPGEMDLAIRRAVLAACGVSVPSAWVTWEDTYVSPVAVRRRLDAVVIAKKLAGTPGVSRVETRGPGLLAVHLTTPGNIAAGIVRDERYGRGERIEGGWPDFPRTFENPGFRVRYGYERAVAVRRRAKDLHVPPGRPEDLTTAQEHRLLGALAAFDGHRKPVLQLERIADAYHDVYESFREEPTPAHGARVILAGAVQITLGNGLRRLGETARERL